MEQLGYFAKKKDDSKGNLFQYEWAADDEFHIMDDDGDMVMVDPDEYEVIEIFYKKG